MGDPGVQRDMKALADAGADGQGRGQAAIVAVDGSGNMAVMEHSAQGAHHPRDANLGKAKPITSVEQLKAQNPEQ